MKYTEENFEKDWCESNAAKVPVMNKMDVDADEEHAGLGCNVSLDQFGETGLLPKVREICGIGPIEGEDLSMIFEKSWAKMDKHFKEDLSMIFEKSWAKMDK